MDKNCDANFILIKPGKMGSCQDLKELYEDFILVIPLLDHKSCLMFYLTGCDG